jgi:hypothetical protein
MNVLDNYKEELLNLGDALDIDDDLNYCKFNYNHMPFMVKTNKICKFNSIKKNKDNYVNISITSTDYLVWFESLYKWCIQTIYERSEDMFDEPLTLSEVEYTFINPLKSNIKNHCFDIQCLTNEDRLHIVDTKDNVYSLDSLSNCNIIPTFHIKGVKMNSNHFSLDIELNNILVILEDLDDENEESSTKDEENKTVSPLSILSTEVKEVKNVKEVKDVNELKSVEPENLYLERDELDEVSIPTDNLEEMNIDIESNGFYEIYELLDEKIKENVIQNLQKIFNKKKIKLNLELTDIFDEEE